jgi:dihydroneopterin aldolase
MDRVFIEGLEVETIIGVHAWEHTIRQRLRLDLEMTFDCRAAGASDALADALDYHAVATTVTAWVETSRHQLLEALAERLAAKLLAEFPIRRLRLCVRKPGAVTNAAAVGVTIERDADAR